MPSEEFVIFLLLGRSGISVHVISGIISHVSVSQRHPGRNCTS